MSAATDRRATRGPWSYWQGDPSVCDTSDTTQAYPWRVVVALIFAPRGLRQQVLELRGPRELQQAQDGALQALPLPNACQQDAKEVCAPARLDEVEEGLWQVSERDRWRLES